jgi:6-pyruvoyltetrahydropterin/6-carboxytetrahydropterin synthase
MLLSFSQKEAFKPITLLKPNSKIMKVTVCRKSYFNAAHRIFNPEWDDRKNEEVFGLCSHPNYHGHNYDLVVKLTGEVNSETGYVFDMKTLKEIVDEHIVHRYDHKNLNLDVPDFADLIPSAENIAVSIWNILRTKINREYAIQIILYETERNFVEYSGG